MATPKLAGTGWRVLFTPVRSGVYVNDHCVVQARDGRWHVFGITKATPDIDPHQERWFCHGSGASLAAGVGVLEKGEGAVAARLAAHAPEYLRDPDTGRWYVTSAGWPGQHFGTVIPGSVAIRELAWSE